MTHTYDPASGPDRTAGPARPSGPRAYADLPISCQAVGQSQLIGDQVPTEWFHTIRTDAGQPDLHAILLLANVWGWHRPRRVTHPRTGETVGWETRFRSDMLQLDYRQISERFGISKPLAKKATDRLVDDGLLVREWRTVMIGGLPQTNVMHLAPVVSRIMAMTYYQQPKTAAQASPQTSPPPPQHWGEGPPEVWGEGPPQGWGDIPVHLPNTPHHTSQGRPRAAAQGLADQVESMVTRVQESTNPPAVLAEIIAEAFGPSFVPQKGARTDFARIASTAKRIGGAGYLARLILQLAASGNRPSGDLLAYVVGIAKRKKQMVTEAAGTAAEYAYLDGAIIEGD